MRILFVFLLLLMAAPWCKAKTSVICNSCACKQLQQAVDQALAHDTIRVKAGNYISINTIINKPLTIIGEGYPVLDGQEKDEVITVLSHNVSITGLDVRNSKTGDMKDFAGIRVFQSSEVSILNCKLSNVFFGIYVGDSRRVTIKGNHSKGAHFGMSDTGNGIQLWKSDSIIVEGNFMEGHRDGIYFEFAKNCIIKNNYCEKNFRYGLHFMFSNDDVYTNNTFTNNGTGVAVMYSHGVHMFHNKFLNNWGDASYGLLLKDITNSIITGNTFSNNTIGINMDGSNRVYLENNDFLKNGYALKIMAKCQQDSFLHNNFSGNTFDVGTNGTLNNNTFVFNYWDKYEGYDLDKNKIGDVPYNPVSLYSVIIEKMPYAVILLRSFTVDMLDRAEKVIPSLVPETILDKSPEMVMLKR